MEKPLPIDYGALELPQWTGFPLENLSGGISCTSKNLHQMDCFQKRKSHSLAVLKETEKFLLDNQLNLNVGLPIEDDFLILPGENFFTFNVRQRI